jgi:hypothetical protein
VRELSGDELASLVEATTFGAALNESFGSLPLSGGRAEAPALSIVVMRMPSQERQSLRQAFQRLMSDGAKRSGMGVDFEEVMLATTPALMWTASDRSGKTGVGASVTFGQIVYAMQASSRHDVVAALEAVHALISSEVAPGSSPPSLP